jgi:hypothetical protein
MTVKQERGSSLRVAVGVVGALLAGTLCISSAYAEKKADVAPGDVPAGIRQAVIKAFPDGKILEAEKETEGEDPGQFDVVIQSGGKKYEVEMSPAGDIKEKKELGAKEGSEDEDEDTSAPSANKKWTDSFGIERGTFTAVGANPFFILEPGYQLVLESKSEKVAITVLEETKKIGNIETRVVEEREEEDGQIKEISRNFYAQCKETGDVFYFGEEVDEYKDGKVASHSGAWRADEPDSKAGIMMPGRILLGARHYQEIAPDAKDRAEIVADDVTLNTPAGEFKNCIRVEETSGLNPKEKAYKVYAPGVGLIQDEDLLLKSHGKVKKD